MSTEDPLVWLVSRAQEWVRAERAARWPRATPLPDRLQAVLTPFFGLVLVESVRYQPVLAIPGVGRGGHPAAGGLLTARDGHVPGRGGGLAGRAHRKRVRAFRLQARFEADPHTPFAVEPIVRADLAAETA